MASCIMTMPQVTRLWQYSNSSWKNKFHSCYIYTFQRDTQCGSTDCLLMLRCQLYMFRTVMVHPQELLFRCRMCRLYNQCCHIVYLVGMYILQNNDTRTFQCQVHSCCSHIIWRNLPHYFRLFHRLKIGLWGQCFTTLKCRARASLHTTPMEAFHKCFKAWQYI